MSNQPTIKYRTAIDFSAAGTARDMGAVLGQVAYKTENPFIVGKIERFAKYLDELRHLYRGNSLSADQLLDELFTGYCSGIDFESKRPDESL